MFIEIHEKNMTMPIPKEPIIINGFELPEIVRCAENEIFFCWQS